MKLYFRKLLRNLLHVIGEPLITALRVPCGRHFTRRVAEHRAEAEVELDLLAKGALDGREPEFGEISPHAEHVGKIENWNPLHLEALSMTRLKPGAFFAIRQAMSDLAAV